MIAGLWCQNLGGERWLVSIFAKTDHQVHITKFAIFKVFTYKYSQPPLSSLENFTHPPLLLGLAEQ